MPLLGERALRLLVASVVFGEWLSARLLPKVITLAAVFHIPKPNGVASKQELLLVRHIKQVIALLRLSLLSSQSLEWSHC